MLCGRVGDGGMVHVGRLTTLTSLDLRRCGCLTDSALAQVRRL